MPSKSRLSTDGTGKPGPSAMPLRISGLRKTERYVLLVRRSHASVMWPPYMISPKM
jgi:hypothetical protein